MKCSMCNKKVETTTTHKTEVSFCCVECLDMYIAEIHHRVIFRYGVPHCPDCGSFDVIVHNFESIRNLEDNQLIVICTQCNGEHTLEELSKNIYKLVI